jgi:hypothetical protein
LHALFTAACSIFIGAQAKVLLGAFSVSPLDFDWEYYALSALSLALVTVGLLGLLFLVL